MNKYLSCCGFLNTCKKTSLPVIYFIKFTDFKHSHITSRGLFYCNLHLTTPVEMAVKLYSL